MFPTQTNNLLKKICAIIFLLVLFGITFLAAPVKVQAELTQDIGAGAGNKTDQVLGKEFGEYNRNTEIGKNNDDPIEVAKKFLTWGTGLAGIIAVGFIIYGGYTYIMAGGNEENIKRGKSLVMKSVIGLVIILAAWLIITTIIGFLKG